MNQKDYFKPIGLFFNTLNHPWLVPKAESRKRKFVGIFQSSVVSRGLIDIRPLPLASVFSMEVSRIRGKRSRSKRKANRAVAIDVQKDVSEKDTGSGLRQCFGFFPSLIWRPCSRPTSAAHFFAEKLQTIHLAK
jgi:hypothetical protein